MACVWRKTLMGSKVMGIMRQSYTTITSTSSMQILQLSFTVTYDYHKDLRLSCHTYEWQDEAAVSVWNTRAWTPPLICSLWKWSSYSQMHTFRVAKKSYPKYIIPKNIMEKKKKKNAATSLGELLPFTSQQLSYRPEMRGQGSLEP